MLCYVDIYLSKEIIIILTCEVGEPVVSASKETDTDLKLKLLAKVLGKS